ncbi:MAG: lipoyltransferase [Duncaniella sp.]|nr:lipoyltransferase [Duncaniella sp.]
MELVLLPDTIERPLAFYLAEEEWLAARWPEREFFFIWQVAPSVIIGRNQLVDKEVNIPFCRDNGVRVFRRKSGGGAVYADHNNLMLSFVTTSGSSVETTFSHYTSAVAASLRRLGLDANDNSRNDILIGDRKVSGNSYCHLSGGRSIVHGTMLYDCDPKMMASVLTPSVSKLRSHGVESVRSRVTTVREHLPELSLEDFRRHLAETIPDGPVLTLSESDIAEIERIEQDYYRPEWLSGKNPPGSLAASRRIDGVGEISVFVRLEGGVISDVSLRGDYLETADASEAVCRSLLGLALDRDRIEEALRLIDLESLIPGLRPETFAELLI